MKPNKLAAQHRKKEINKQKSQKTNRLAKGQDTRKVHDTKGKNRHGRMF